MIKKLLIILAVLSGSLVFAAPAAAFNPLGQACDNAPNNPACAQANSQGTKDPIAGPGGIINTAANIIAIVAGIAAVIIIIIGGLGYVTSGGNAEAATKARQRILGAVIGLVVVALAWAIVSFVSDRVIK